MSRMSNVLDRLEKVALKLGMCVEDAISILEGKHPTQTVTEKTASDEAHNITPSPTPIDNQATILKTIQSIPGANTDATTAALTQTVTEKTASDEAQVDVASTPPAAPASPAAA